MFPLQAHHGSACFLPYPCAFVPSCCYCSIARRRLLTHRKAGASGTGFGFGPYWYDRVVHSPSRLRKIFLHQVPSLDKALTTRSSPKPAMAVRITTKHYRSRMRMHVSLLIRLSPRGLELRSGTCLLALIAWGALGFIVPCPLLTPY